MRARPFAIVSLSLLCGCADLGKYIWADAYEAPPVEQGFLIAPGDVLAIKVYNQEAMTTRAKVRSDGSITVPLINDIVAAGYSPFALSQQMEVRLREFLKVPVVSVAVEEAAPLAIPVVGEVAKPAVVLAERQSGLLKVLVLAGGLTDFAHKDRIFVLRPGKTPLRIRFTWESLTRGGTAAARFELRAGDTVVVE